MFSLLFAQAIGRAALCATLALGLIASAIAADDKRNVLVLGSRDSMQPAYELFMSGFRARAQGPGAGRLELFAEFLDSARFPQVENRLRMSRLLREKYAAIPIHLVITTSPYALGFVMEYQQALFPNVPVVFALVSAGELPPQPLPNHMIGILDRFDLGKTFEMARRLQPDARRVVVVTGADVFDKMWEGIARREFSTAADGVEFDYWSGLPLPRCWSKSRGCPETRSLYFSGHAGRRWRSFRPPEVAQRVAAESGAPTYSVFPSYMGRGVVGGYMNSFEAVGAQAAAVALQLLSGETPATLRTKLGPEGAYVADARQLQRWGLSESRLPEGSVVRFKEPSIWDAYRWYIVAAALAIIAQTALISMLIVQRRRRRSAEVEVQHQRTELGHASRLATLGELSASIAHEVNQPLGAIAGNADAVELLLDADPPKMEEAKRVLRDLKRANERASDVVLRLRQLLRKRELAFEPYDVNEVASEVIRLLETEAAGRGVPIVPELRPLPVIHGDRLHFQQVLLNLLVNGMDAMADAPTGRKRLAVRTAHNDDGEVEITVTDTGRGIAAADLPRLFDSFFTTKKDGMGLGLSLCRSIVQAHGGRISATNNLSGGATFTVLLPVDADRRVRRAPVLSQTRDFRT